MSNITANLSTNLTNISKEVQIAVPWKGVLIGIVVIVLAVWLGKKFGVIDKIRRSLPFLKRTIIIIIII